MDIEAAGDSLPPLACPADAVVALAQQQILDLPGVVRIGERAGQLQGLAAERACQGPVGLQLQVLINHTAGAGDRPAQRAGQFGNEELGIQFFEQQLDVPGNAAEQLEYRFASQAALVSSQ